jgi:hypothetical protein
MPAGLVYLFVSKFRATFAEYKERGRSYEQKFLQIIWTKSIPATWNILNRKRN